jgi:hypothetical protein
MKWETTTMGNEVLDGDGFFISYQPNQNVLGIKSFSADTSSGETALVNKKASSFFYLILNGNFKKEYEKLVPLGYDACVKFFNEMKKKHKSSWSN